MIDRWNLDTQITELAASMMYNAPANDVHPNYVNLPNKEYLYPVVKNRKLLECENNSDLSMYVYSDDIKETDYSNCSFKCECFVVVGVIRKKDTLIPKFNEIKSAISMFFGVNGMDKIFAHLEDGEDFGNDVRLGTFGISRVEIQSSRKQVDKCGIWNFEALVKFTLYFKRF